MNVLDNATNGSVMTIVTTFLVTFGIKYYMDASANNERLQLLEAANVEQFARDEYSSRVIRLCEESGGKCSKVLFHVDYVFFGSVEGSDDASYTVFWDKANDHCVVQDDGSGKCSFKLIEAACGNVNHVDISVFAFPDEKPVIDEKLRENLNLNGLFLGPDGFYCHLDAEPISKVGFTNTKG
ncbi:MAG: hypothetical protein WCT46_02315 [Candidatus Gracilibacteria bacterium]|jgi:hypothetical protein